MSNSQSTEGQDLPQLILSHGQKLSFQDIIDVCIHHRPCALAPETSTLIDERRSQICTFIQESAAPSYGFNRGFGHNVKEAINPDDVEQLQRNLILSHACCVGEPIEDEVVRASMLLRAQSLSQGYSGIRSVLITRLIDFINEDVCPIIPRLGSVSASGDLAPLSHIALALIGEGDVRFKGEVMSAQDAHAKLKWTPLRLEMKEGLALNNGVQYTNALCLILVDRLESLLNTAILATSLTAQVCLGSDTPYRQDLHLLRPHSGACRVAAALTTLMADSPLREAHRPYDIDGEVQDPYNLRCAPQILGTCLDLIEHAKCTFLIEANSVTDNPLILKATADHGWDQRYGGRYLDQYVDIVSGGHFHGMPLATAAYSLIEAIGIMSRLSNMRSARYVDEVRNRGLGSDVRWPGLSTDPQIQRQQSISSGMMIPEYVSAGLTNWIWGQAMPTHLFSLSTDAGQEDHVSMAANVALRTLDTLPRLAEVLAIECAFAAQAAAIRKEMDGLPSKHEHADLSSTRYTYPLQPEQRKLSPAGEIAITRIGVLFPPVTEDRYMAKELQALAASILEGELHIGINPAL